MNALAKHLPKRFLAIAGAAITALTGLSLTEPAPTNDPSVPVSVLSVISPEAQAKLQAAQREMEAAIAKVNQAKAEVMGQIETVRPKVEDAAGSIQGILDLFRENPLIALLAGGAALLFGDYRKTAPVTGEKGTDTNA